MVTNFIFKLVNDGYQNKTIKDILIILKQIFKCLNINLNITMPKVRKKEILVLSNDNQVKLEKYILKNINLETCGIYLCLYTGLRLGELCALKWENIDLNKKSIKVEKTLIRVKNFENDGHKTKVILDNPKSESSVRIIPIPDFLVPILKKFENNSNNEDFFLTGSKKYMETRCYTNHFNKIMKLLDMEEYNFHVLRHTFATNCILKGCDIKSLSEILGHSSVKITLDRYVHPSFKNKRAAINKLHPLVK